MKQSQLFTKTQKNISKDEPSINAQLLERGGFVYKNSAGIYSYLPFGWRVMQKIIDIVREEMNAVGGQEIFMPALHDKKYLKATGRWDVDVVFKVLSGEEKEPSFNISWTHEEIMAEIASKYVNSYKDLPFATYQFQTKFRNEKRAKSGILRGREFMMKDMYSFHASEEDLFNYYEEVKKAYHKVFDRCGLKAVYVVAGGGEFTLSNTHEFQVFCPVGEDTIYYCPKCEYAENSEITKMEKGGKCSKCDGEIREEKAIEVGNIFPLGTKYSEAFNLRFTNEKGENKLVVMGSYGIGISRLMGTIVEAFHDEKGIIWPENVAPFKVHLIEVSSKNKEVGEKAEEIYEMLAKKGVEVLYDDRKETSAGEKFAEADLIGMPYRIVVSERTLKSGGPASNASRSDAGWVEVKKRNEKESQILKAEELVNYLTK